MAWSRCFCSSRRKVWSIHIEDRTLYNGTWLHTIAMLLETRPTFVYAWTLVVRVLGTGRQRGNVPLPESLLFLLAAEVEE